jgi:glucans biosynthesis protein
MHGGAKGSGGPRGNRNGNFKHGQYTHEAKAVHKAVRAKVREIKTLIGR